MSRDKMALAFLFVLLALLIGQLAQNSLRADVPCDRTETVTVLATPIEEIGETSSDIEVITRCAQ